MGLGSSYKREKYVSWCMKGKVGVNEVGNPPPKRKIGQKRSYSNLLVESRGITSWCNKWIQNNKVHNIFKIFEEIIESLEHTCQLKDAKYEEVAQVKNKNVKEDANNPNISTPNKKDRVEDQLISQMNEIEKEEWESIKPLIQRRMWWMKNRINSTSLYP